MLRHAGSRAPGIEYYYYDQLGPSAATSPTTRRCGTSARFVDEVEQVRQALGLDSSNFVLLGQSWGGLLAMEYAVHHQQHLKGLVISNMMSSAPLYNAYANDVLMPDDGPGGARRDQAVRGRRRRPTTRATSSCSWSTTTSCTSAGCRSRSGPTRSPDRSATSIPPIYVPMQGPSELGLSGTLETWDRSGDLQHIDVPTLVIGATHDTMDPEHMRWMSEQLPQGRYLHCPDGSHLAQFDDPEHYFPGLDRLPAVSVIPVAAVAGPALL